MKFEIPKNIKQSLTLVGLKPVKTLGIEVLFECYIETFVEIRTNKRGATTGAEWRCLPARQFLDVFQRMLCGVKRIVELQNV